MGEDKKVYRIITGSTWTPWNCVTVLGYATGDHDAIMDFYKERSQGWIEIELVEILHITRETIEEKIRLLERKKVTKEETAKVDNLLKSIGKQ